MDSGSRALATQVRGLHRVRETHVRDHLAPWLAKGAAGVVAIDLALRGLAAAEPNGAGEIDQAATWEAVHDLVRARKFRPMDRGVKRAWVSDKLLQLERANLIRRYLAPGKRPKIVVLSDRGDGGKFDDPGSAGDPYVSILGPIIEFGALARWGSPQITAYLAAMIAERYARADPAMSTLMSVQRGGGIWFRSLRWFADEEGRRPAHHIRIPFSERTLRRGIMLLKDEGLMATRRVSVDPRTGRPFAGGHSRLIYFNGFEDMRPAVGSRGAQARAWRFAPGGSDS